MKPQKMQWLKLKVLLMAIGASLCFILADCSSTRSGHKTADCNTAVTLRAMELDGCNWLLITSDNEKLLASNLDEAPFSPEDGKKLRINYEILDDMASICMAEDHIVRVTCWETVP